METNLSIPEKNVDAWFERLRVGATMQIAIDDSDPYMSIYVTRSSENTVQAYIFDGRKACAVVRNIYFRSPEAR